MNLSDNLMEALGEYEQRFDVNLLYNLRFLKDGVEDEYAQFIRDHIESGTKMTEDEEMDERFFDVPPDDSLW